MADNFLSSITGFLQNPVSSIKNTAANVVNSIPALQQGSQAIIDQLQSNNIPQFRNAQQLADYALKTGATDLQNKSWWSGSPYKKDAWQIIQNKHLNESISKITDSRPVQDIKQAILPLSQSFSTIVDRFKNNIRNEFEVTPDDFFPVARQEQEFYQRIGKPGGEEQMQSDLFKTAFQPVSDAISGLNDLLKTPSGFIDVAKDIFSGAGKGAYGAVGGAFSGGIRLFGNTVDFLNSINPVAPKLPNSPKLSDLTNPLSEQVSKATEHAMGLYGETKTLPGKVAEILAGVAPMFLLPKFIPENLSVSPLLQKGLGFAESGLQFGAFNLLTSKPGQEASSALEGFGTGVAFGAAGDIFGKLGDLAFGSQSVGKVLTRGAGDAMVGYVMASADPNATMDDKLANALSFGLLGGLGAFTQKRANAERAYQEIGNLVFGPKGEQYIMPDGRLDSGKVLAAMKEKVATMSESAKKAIMEPIEAYLASPKMRKGFIDPSKIWHDLSRKTSESMSGDNDPIPADYKAPKPEELQQLSLLGDNDPAPNQTTGKKTSKVAQSIENKVVESGLSQGFSDLAGYDPITIRDQAKRASDLMQSDMEKAKQMVMGEIPMEPGLRGEMLIKAMEDHAMAKGDAKLAMDIANSPLVSETSAHAQALRILAERNPDSAVIKMREVRQARQEAALKQLQKVKSVKLDKVNDIRDLKNEARLKIKDIQDQIKAKEDAYAKAKAKQDRADMRELKKGQSDVMSSAAKDIEAKKNEEVKALKQQMRDIQKETDKKVREMTKTKAQTIEKAKSDTVKEIKDEIKKTAPKKQDWLSFIDSITCA